MQYRRVVWRDAPLNLRLPKALGIVFAFALCAARAQGPSLAGLSLATDDRVDDAGWWPTKGDAPRSQYVGAATCQRCHAQIAQTQQTTPMYHAAVRAQGSAILKAAGQFTFREPGFDYALTYSPASVTFSARDASTTAQTPVTWAFGSGQYGQTYMLEKNGSYIEARLSYFTSLHGVNITPGQSEEKPQGVDEAQGHKLDQKATRQCFACHTTEAVTGKVLDSAQATAGVTCEACHGPGAAHVSAMKAGKYEQGSTTILNPQSLSPSDSVDFCGACHRTWADVMMEMPANLGAARVRFQPYRLELSRCWGKGADARLTCMACHDPHQPLVHELSAYDAKCLACHSGRPLTKPYPATKTCKVAKSNCASCHMPKVEVPEAHAVFTDHDIRVVRPGA